MTILLALALATAPVTADPLAARLAQSVQSALEQRLHAAGRTGQVRITGRIALPALAGSEARFEIGEVAGRFPRAQVAVPVRLHADGRAVQAVTVWASISDPQWVMTYRTAHASDTPSQALDLAPAWVDMVCCDGPALAQSAIPGDARLARRVEAGAPVLVADFRSARTIERGHEVEVRVGRGSSVLTTSGVALEDGQPGDRISVHALASGKRVTARVLAPGKVAIDE